MWGEGGCVDERMCGDVPMDLRGRSVPMDLRGEGCTNGP